MPELLLLSEQLKDFASGLGTYARGLARGLAKRGHEVALAVPAEQAVDGEPYRILSLDFPRGNVTPFSRPRMVRALRRLLAAETPPRGLVHFLDARWSTLLSPADPPRPVLGTVHDSYALDWRTPGYPRGLYRDRLVRSLYYRWLRRVEGRAYRRLRALLANSDHVARAILDGYAVLSDRVRVVRLGLPASDPVAPLDLAGEPSVLFVGGNFQRKGLPALLAAIRLLAGDFPGIRLHVVGGDPHGDAFRRAAAADGIDEHVTFHGFRPNEEVRGLMASADAFAMPSLVEAFGLVYLEAMRAGTPVIATSRGGAAECFRDREEALLVPPADAQAVASALRAIATDEALRDRLVRGGRAAAERLSFENTITETEAAYADLLEMRQR